MKRFRLICSIATLLFFVVAAAPAVSAETITIQIYPTDVPDEQPPRVNVGDAPAGFGPDSWQGPASGKSNWHARYLADGDALSDLFPDDAATLTIADLAEISYYTNRPSGTPAGRDWWVQVYTRPTGVGDNASWHHDRFINNYADHATIDVWTLHSTSSGMTFDSNGLNGPEGEMTLTEFIAAHGDELIEMISVQTDSGWNGFDGFMDGLVITLTNGNVGRVNFEGADAAPALTIAPDPLSFPNQPAGTTSAPGTVTLSNTGSADLAILAIDPAVAPFAEVTANSTCSPLPFTLAPSESCTLEYTYTPVAPGDEDDQVIAVTTDVPGAADSFVLQGNAPALTVTEIPTLSEVGLVALVILLLGAATLRLRRPTA
jgi:hypothetical protein